MYNLLKFTRNNVSTLVKVFLIPMVVFTTSICLLMLEYLEITKIINDIDKPIHFVCGSALSLGLIILVKNLESSQLIRKQRTITKLYIIFTAIITIVVLWEFMEFALDTFFKTTFQDSLHDTMTDMLLGTIGGIFTLMFYNVINIKMDFCKY